MRGGILLAKGGVLTAKGGGIGSKKGDINSKRGGGCSSVLYIWFVFIRCMQSWKSWHYFDINFNFDSFFSFSKYIYFRSRYLINVIYHSTSHYHSNDSSKSQLISHKDDDSEINHITYLICKVSRRLILWFSSLERDQNKILFESRDNYICFVSVLFILFCFCQTWYAFASSKILITWLERSWKSCSSDNVSYSFYIMLLICILTQWPASWFTCTRCWLRTFYYAIEELRD
jgi:hypothetical protein